MTCELFVERNRVQFSMEFLTDIHSPNKAVRRSALRNVLKEFEAKDAPQSLESDSLLLNLPYDDEYDTCRELSYRIVGS